MKPGNAPCPDDATTMDDATGAVHPSRIDLDRNDFALDFELVFQLVAAGAERYIHDFSEFDLAWLDDRTLVP